MFSKIFSFLFVFTVGVSAHAALQCTNQLNDQLAEQPDWILEPNEPEADEVPIQCIRQSMNVFYQWTTDVRLERQAKGQREIGHYVYCDPNSDRVIKKHEPPCPTDDYLNTIANSYNAVLKCLGYSPKDLFAITAVESGFQINTLSLAGVDIGIGQMTPIAVEDINPHWDEYVAEIMSSDSVDCEKIKPMVAEMQPSEGDITCDLTLLPENPIKNLIYISFLHKKNDDYMNRLFEIHGIPSKIAELVGRPLKETELTNLKNILVALSYNAGSPTAVDALEQFILKKREPIEGVEQRVAEITREAALAYLASQDARVSGDLAGAEILLTRREELLTRLDEIQEGKTKYRVPVESFAITEETGSFGHFLVLSDISFYLEILQDRIEYVEGGIDAPGACAPDNYLESI